MQLILFLSSILLCFQSKALDFNGTIFEKGTKKELTNVNVFVLPKGLKGTTQQDGKFEVSGIEEGEKEIIVNLSGYKRFKTKINFTTDVENYNIYLEKNSYMVFETTVFGKKKEKDSSKQTLKQEEFLLVPGSNGDPVKAVENLPGASQNYDSRVAIQGSPPEDTKYFIEGHEIPFIFHFGGLNSVAVPETIASIDFLTAGFGPEFGRASSGIINLNLKRPEAKKVKSMAFVDFLSSGGFVTGPISENQSFFIGGRYSYAGAALKFVTENITSDDEDEGPPTFNTAPTFFDINAQHFVKLNDQSEINTMLILSKDEVELIIEEVDEPTFAGGISGFTEFFRVIPSYKYRFNKEYTFSSSLGIGVDHQQFEPGSQKLETTYQVLSLRTNIEKSGNKKFNFDLGLDSQYKSYKEENRISSSFFNEEDIETPESVAEMINAYTEGEQIEIGTYLRPEFKFFGLSLIPGFRHDYFKGHDDHLFAPRVSVSYGLTELSSLSFQTGHYYQAATNRNLEPATGNPDLDPAKSIHYTLKFDQEIKNKIFSFSNFSGSLFYKDLVNVFQRSESFVYRNDELVAEVVNNKGEGDIKGFQTMLTLKNVEYQFNIGYTYTDSTLVDEYGVSYPSKFDTTHNLNLTANYSLGNWNFGARFRYITGVPYTPITGGVLYENSDVYIPIAGEKLSQRYDDFWQLDVRIDKKWVYDTWILSLYLDIQNVTNHKNNVSKEYNFNYSDSADATGLPILPTFGVKGEF